MWPCCAVGSLLAQRYTDVWLVVADSRVRGKLSFFFLETLYPWGTLPSSTTPTPIEKWSSRSPRAGSCRYQNILSWSMFCIHSITTFSPLLLTRYLGVWVTCASMRPVKEGGGGEKRGQQKLPWWLSGKESACSAGDQGSIPGLGKIPWRRKWQPTPVFLPGKFHEQRNLAGYSPWGHKESDMTKHAGTHRKLDERKTLYPGSRSNGTGVCHQLSGLTYSQEAKGTEEPDFHGRFKARGSSLRPRLQVDGLWSHGPAQGHSDPSATQDSRESGGAKVKANPFPCECMCVCVEKKLVLSDLWKELLTRLVLGLVPVGLGTWISGTFSPFDNWWLWFILPRVLAQTTQLMLSTVGFLWVWNSVCARWQGPVCWVLSVC